MCLGKLSHEPAQFQQQSTSQPLAGQVRQLSGKKLNGISQASSKVNSNPPDTIFIVAENGTVDDC
jgi:hypothetical protein